MLRTVLNMIDEPDVVSLLALIGLLAVIGEKMTAGTPALRTWSRRLSAAALVAYLLYGLQKFSPHSAGDFLGVVVRGLFAAGLMSGCSQIALAAGFFAYQYVNEARQLRLQAARARVEASARIEAVPRPAPPERAEPTPKPRSLKEIAEHEKQVLEDRLAAIEVVKDLIGLEAGEQAMRELKVRETEKSLRRISEEMGYE